MQQIMVVFVGGGIGAAARFWMSGQIHSVTTGHFPYGTLTVNFLGSLLIGFLMALFSDRFFVNHDFRLLLTVGFLGGFTTFSTFTYETIQLMRDGQLASALLNILGSILLCLLATWAGFVLGRQL